MMKQQHPAQLDEAPFPLLGAMIGHKPESVIGHSELKHAREIGIARRDRVKFFLRNTERGRATPQRRIALKALRNAFPSDPIREAPHQLLLREVPFPHHLAGAFAQQLVLYGAAQRRRLGANKLGLRLGDEASSELQELLGILRAGIAERVDSEI